MLSESIRFLSFLATLWFFGWFAIFVNMEDWDLSAVFPCLCSDIDSVLAFLALSIFAFVALPLPFSTFLLFLVKLGVEVSISFLWILIVGSSIAEIDFFFINWHLSKLSRLLGNTKIDSLGITYHGDGKKGNECSEFHLVCVFYIVIILIIIFPFYIMILNGYRRLIVI